MSGWATALFALGVLFAAGTPARAQEPSSQCEPGDLAMLSGWGGIWVAEGKEAGISGRGDNPDFKLVGLGAPWNDDGLAKLAEVLRTALSGGKQSGWGYPMMMDIFAEFKFIIAPAETAIISQYREIRYVYTDGRQHVPEDERWPTNWGDSIGCWHGDTLAIDTVSVRFDPVYNYFAPPLSDDAHFVEHLRLVAPGRIEGEMTITDPATLTAPWTIPLAYKRIEGLDRLIHDGDTFENDRSVADENSWGIAPPRDKAFTPRPLPAEAPLSTAELDRIVGTYAFEGAPLKLIVERRDKRLHFEVPPALIHFLPMFAQSPVSFISIDGGTFQFTVDEAGNVTGFTGTGSDGAPVSGKRVVP
jgi:hypothetical protein